MGCEGEEEGRPVSSGGQDASEVPVRLCRVAGGLGGITAGIAALAFFIAEGVKGGDYPCTPCRIKFMNPRDRKTGITMVAVGIFFKHRQLPLQMF
jgi:hypothetical protein